MDKPKTRTIFCPNCGTPSFLGEQKFCEKCGTQLPLPEEVELIEGIPIQTIQNATQTQQEQPISYKPEGILFNKRNMDYVVQEKFWDFGSGPIFNAQGQQIGKMKRRMLSFRQKVEFREMDDSIVCSIHRKILAFKPTYTLVDKNEQEIAHLEKKLFTFAQPKFQLKDPMGHIIFTAVGKFLGFDFNIYRGMEEDPKQIVGEIHKADRWEDFFFGGWVDFKDTYGVKILDPDVDRRKILGFVIAIDNVMHDQ
jgi:uncharacterized protein YxjI